MVMEHFHGAMMAFLQKWHSMQNIGGMDTDQMIDVPDTPDRVAAQNINCEGCVENGSDTSVAGASGKSNFLLRGRSTLISEDGHNRGLYFHSHNTFNNPEATERRNNVIFHSSENSSVSRNTHIYGRMIAGKSFKRETGNSFGDQLMDKGKALGDKPPVKASIFQEGNADLNTMEQTGYSQILGKSKMHGASKQLLGEEFKEGSIATNRSLNCTPNSSKTAGTYRKGKEKASDDTGGGLGMDHRKGIDFTGGFSSKIGKIVSAPPLTLPRVTGQKRLVRNGCISPHNIAKAKQSAEQKQNTSDSKDSRDTNTGNLVFRSPSCLRDSPEGNNHVRTKGKGSILHSCTARESDVKNRHFPGSSTRHNEGASGASDVNGNVYGGFEDLGGWRSTGNRSKKLHLPLPDEDVNLTRIHNDAKTLIKRQKNHGSTSSGHGEYSASDFDDSEIMFLGSSVESSNSSTAKNWSCRRRCILDPVIEVDEISPEMRLRDSQHVAHKNDGDSDARARQLEADEVLALELQQQLYQETPIRGGGEIDAHIAWTLQQEEAAQRASSSGSPAILHPRVSSFSTTHRQSQSRSLQDPSRRRRLHARLATSARMAPLRTRSRSQAPSILPRERTLYPLPLDMDLDMRIDILEALEAIDGDFGDMRMENHILQVHRDFNENDYEMLLALDENNYQHGGAPVDQINRLPQSIVQTENLEEACAICLETPTAGETIRHLPCLHKFHKDCIDPWLSRRTSCPVCKSSIT